MQRILSVISSLRRKRYCVICHGLKSKDEPLVDKAYDYRDDASFLIFNVVLCERHEQELIEHILKPEEPCSSDCT